MEPILVVMAAGMGSRYGGAKQIDPISADGDIIMDFSLYDAWQAGFRRVVFVIKAELEETFRAHIDARAGQCFEVHYVCQELADLPDGFTVPEGRVKPWGTGHAVLAARSVIDAPFAVINADDYYGAEAFRLIYRYLRDEADAVHHCMVGFRVENTLSENGTVSRGICKVQDGALTDIEEHTEVGRIPDGTITGIGSTGDVHNLPEGTPVSMNLWGFGAPFIDVMKEKFPAALRRILSENPEKGEFYLPSCINEEIQSGAARVDALSSSDRWFGVTYREDRAAVVEQFARMKNTGKYPQHLWR